MVILCATKYHINDAEKKGSGNIEHCEQVEKMLLTCIFSICPQLFLGFHTQNSSFELYAFKQQMFYTWTILKYCHLIKSEKNRYATACVPMAKMHLNTLPNHKIWEIANFEAAADKVNEVKMKRFVSKLMENKVEKDVWFFFIQNVSKNFFHRFHNIMDEGCTASWNRSCM